jgi:ribosome biogenesis GTPase
MRPPGSRVASSRLETCASTADGALLQATLTQFGLTPFFVNQLTVDELEDGRIGRVIELQRSLLRVYDGSGELTLPLLASNVEVPPEERPTVGDWVLMDEQRTRVMRVLERKSVFKRVAAGEKAEVQLVAANVDILFVVTSCNEEFNESRLERYLSLAAEAHVMAVVVLTKADLCESPDAFVDRARGVQSGLPVLAVNALDASSLAELAAWIEPGSAVALVGSSGVGKTTLLNTLMGTEVGATAGIREDDKKGRHTTSHRALHELPGGGLLIDVPGMRELKVAAIDEALGEVFGEIEALASRCRFHDCRHETEPGCAVREAIESGELDNRRLANYQKLLRESAFHNASLAEARKKDREFGKMIKQVLDLKKRR